MAVFTSCQRDTIHCNRAKLTSNWSEEPVPRAFPGPRDRTLYNGFLGHEVIGPDSSWPFCTWAVLTVFTQSRLCWPQRSLSAEGTSRSDPSLLSAVLGNFQECLSLGHSCHLVPFVAFVFQRPMLLYKGLLKSVLQSLWKEHEKEFLLLKNGINEIFFNLFAAE